MIIYRNNIIEPFPNRTLLAAPGHSNIAKPTYREDLIAFQCFWESSEASEMLEVGKKLIT